VNVNERSSVTDLQLTTCVFHSNYAFLLTVEGLTGCALSLTFCRYKALKCSLSKFLVKWGKETAVQRSGII